MSKGGQLFSIPDQLVFILGIIDRKFDFSNVQNSLIV